LGCIIFEKINLSGNKTPHFRKKVSLTDEEKGLNPAKKYQHQSKKLNFEEWANLSPSTLPHPGSKPPHIHLERSPDC